MAQLDPLGVMQSYGHSKVLKLLIEKSVSVVWHRRPAQILDTSGKNDAMAGEPKRAVSPTALGSASNAEDKGGNNDRV